VRNAARLIVDERIDAERAVALAAAELGLRADRQRPTRCELAAQVLEIRRLFHPEQLERLTEARKTAFSAMQALAAHQPRLFGALVDGVGRVDRIELLLRTETVEAVIFDLQDRAIPWRSTEVTLLHTRGRHERYPALAFEAADFEVSLVVPGIRPAAGPPRDVIDGSPLVLLSTAEVEALVSDTGDR
jgi:hypothetical protein